MNDLTPEEINSLAVVVASLLGSKSSKKEIISIKFFLSQIISNLGSYLLD